MGENKPIYTVNNFKFSIFDSVPKPDNDTAYILYREGVNFDKILVITAQQPTTSSTIKAGGYNKIVEVSLAWREFDFRKKIADKTNNFIFNIMVNLNYRISNCVDVFKTKIDNLEEKIQNEIEKIIENCHKKYDIEDQIELESDLKNKIAQKLCEITYMECRGVSVEADMDERATRIMNSALDGMVTEVVDRNTNEQLSRKIEEEKEIKLKQLDAEKEIQKRKNALNIEKAEGIKFLEEKLGINYGAFLAYMNGEINSTEFDARVQQNRNTAMEAKLQSLKQLVEIDALPGPALERVAVKLLGEGSEAKQSEHEQQKISNSSVTDGYVVVEDTEEY